MMIAPITHYQNSRAIDMPQPQPSLCQGTLDFFLGLKQTRQTSVTSFLKGRDETTIITGEARSYASMEANAVASMSNSRYHGNIPEKVKSSLPPMSSSVPIKPEPVISWKDMEPAKSRKRSRTPRKPDTVPSSMESSKKELMYINKRIARAFERQVDGKTIPIIYYGTIISVTRDLEPFLWHVRYDDKDEEEMEEEEIRSSLTLYQIFETYDPKAAGNVHDKKRKTGFHLSAKQKRIR
jgi:hypothetical protein